MPLGSMSYAMGRGDGDMDVYTVRRGDTLGRIASRYRCVNTSVLAEINNVRSPRYLIRVGQQLRIPGCP